MSNYRLTTKGKRLKRAATAIFENAPAIIRIIADNKVTEEEVAKETGLPKNLVKQVIAGLWELGLIKKVK